MIKTVWVLLVSVINNGYIDVNTEVYKTKVACEHASKQKQKDLASDSVIVQVNCGEREIR